jgi:hypothetical protein
MFKIAKKYIPITNKPSKKLVKKGGSQKNAVRDYSSYENIYNFGDLEGQFPFTRIKATSGTPIIEDEKPETYKNREAYFPKTHDGANFIELDHNKFIKINTSYKHKDAFVFTGDLLDHGKYDIRWLIAIVNNPYPESILCAIGNRDFNKTRRIDESFIVKQSANASAHTNISSIWADVIKHDGTKRTLTEFITYMSSNWTDYKFAYDYNKISERFAVLKDEARINKVMPFYNKLNDPISRIRDIYSAREACGINEFSRELVFPSYNYDELIEIGILTFNPNHDEFFKCILINVINMIMGVKWNNEIVKQFPQGCDMLNGLYIDYLNHACFYGRIITNHNNEVAILSHGLINNYISIPIVYGLDDDNNSSNNNSNNNSNHKNKNKDIGELFNSINYDKNRFIDEFNLYWNDLQINGSLNTHANYTNTTFNKAFHNFNNFYYARAPNKGEFEFTEKLYQKNTGGINTDDVKTINIITDYDYKYNIYGHSPQVLVPSIATAHDNENHTQKYYICIDISNIGPFKPCESIETYNGYMNAYLNTGAFSYVVLKNDSIKIKGVITKGNFIIDSNVKFPIRYTKTFTNEKSLTKYNAFKDDFNERDFGHRNIKFTQLHIN